MKRDRLRPKKELGQVFLADKTIAAKIVAAAGLQNTNTVLEIGPGEGVLTRLLLEKAGEVIAVEIDARYFEKLKKEFEGKNLRIALADFLQFDCKDLPIGITVVSNLPYYLSSPIIEKLLYNRKHFIDLYLTVQLEFGNRLAAAPGTKEYGALSCFAQYYAHVKKLFKIKNASFRPIPKVDSCLVHLHLRPPPYPADDEEFLFRLIQHAFEQRRKVLTNAFLPLIKKDKILPVLEKLHIRPELRPENLSVQDFVEIAHTLIT